LARINDARNKTHEYKTKTVTPGDRLLEYAELLLVRQIDLKKRVFLTHI